MGRVALRGIGSAVIDAASEKRMVDAVGAWLSDVDEHHGLIVANLSPVDVGLPAPIQLFIINDEYCQRHPVPACASSPNVSTVTGTVPGSLSSVEPRIRHAIAQQLSASAKAGKATIKWSRQEGSHDYFTYGPQSPEQGLSATMTDPVVIRVPSGLLSGDDLTTALTTGGILLLDPNSESRRVTSSPSLARAVAKHLTCRGIHSPESFPTTPTVADRGPRRARQLTHCRGNVGEHHRNVQHCAPATKLGAQTPWVVGALHVPTSCRMGNRFVGHPGHSYCMAIGDLMAGWTNRIHRGGKATP